MCRQRLHRVRMLVMAAISEAMSKVCGRRLATLTESEPGSRHYECASRDPRRYIYMRLRSHSMAGTAVDLPRGV
jgi:hypothetical protein